MSKPLVHLSARAYEWLTKHETFYPKPKTEAAEVYVAPVGLSACNRKRLGRALLCGVEDVRAMYLGLDYKALATFPPLGSMQYLKTRLNAPTCPKCRVLFDKACDSSTRKRGRWIEIDDTGGWKWVGAGERSDYYANSLEPQ